MEVLVSCKLSIYRHLALEVLVSCKLSIEYYRHLALEVLVSCKLSILAFCFGGFGLCHSFTHTTDRSTDVHNFYIQN